jgi:hypothetical protein
LQTLGKGKGIGVWRISDFWMRWALFFEEEGTLGVVEYPPEGFLFSMYSELKIMKR